MTPPGPEPILKWAAGGRRGGLPGGPDGAVSAVGAPEAADGSGQSGIWLNGTGIAIEERGIAILGSPGRGKSSLALALMALGGVLIADDGLWLATDTPPPRLVRPAQSPDLIEARGIGLIRAGRVLAEAPLVLVVDLDRAEAERLPPIRQVAVGASLCPLILGADNPSLAPALMLLVRHGPVTV